MGSAKKALISALANRVGELPDGVDLDGAGDYFSRSSDLIGNADGKTFTFSCWVYPLSQTEWFYASSDDTSGSTAGLIVMMTLNKLRIRAYTSEITEVFNVDSADGLPLNSWSHLILSVDLADSSRRALRINDTEVSVSWDSYDNAEINFTRTRHYVANNYQGGNPAATRMAHLFLDYTYRDLSTEANRRLFTEYDPYRGLVPAANQQALNPIIYMPFDDPEAFGKNLGYGGDFIQHGVMALSGRGPGQYNAPARRFDGNADYLERSGGTGLSDSTQFVFSCWVRPVFSSGTCVLFAVTSNASPRERFKIELTESNGYVDIRILGFSSSLAYSLLANLQSGCAVGKWLSIQCSCDLSDPARRHLIVNGVDYTEVASWGYYLPEALDFSSSNSPAVRIGCGYTTSSSLLGDISSVYFDVGHYVDLSDCNPFLSESGSPSYLGEYGEIPTGEQPAIYTPMNAGRPSENKGWLAGFENKASVTGARGPSEYWARAMSGSSMAANANSMILPISSGNSALYSGVVAFKYNDDETDAGIFGIGDGSASGGLGFYVDGSGPVGIRAIYGLMGASGYLGSVGNGWNTVFFSRVDPSTMYFYCINQDGTDYETTLNYSAAISAQNVYLGAAEQSTSTTRDFLGFIGGVYVSQTYIDFSQEENRLLFVDALGYPVPLQPSVDAGLIPEGLVRMEFDPAKGLGHNSGTAGDFQIVGTVTPGADVMAQE